MSDSFSYIPALKYSFLTPFYDTIIRLLVPEKRIRTFITSLITSPNKAALLDVGAGTGTQLHYVHKKHPLLVLHGWDVDTKIMAIAAKKLGNDAQLCCTSTAQLPYPKDTFDWVVCTWVLHHLTDKQKIDTLQEIQRVLKPKGTLILGDWGKPKTIWLQMAFGLVQFIDNFETMRAHREGEIPSLLTASAFQEVQEKKHFATLLGSFYVTIATK